MNFVSGGLLGDFIYQLYVIKEYYDKTGKKGNLFISNHGDKFYYGLEKAYKDTYDVIKSQPYIDRYEIYTDQPFDVNLSSWRNNRLLCQTNLHYLYKDEYKVDWGRQKWLDLPTDERWKNIVVITTNCRRFPAFIDFTKVASLFKCVFVTQDMPSYHHFKDKTLVNIPYYLTDFKEFCTIINSCKLLIANLSAPLTVGMACHADLIIAATDNILELILNEGFDFRKGIYYTIDGYLKDHPIESKDIVT